MVIDAGGAGGTDPRKRGGRTKQVMVALRPEEWAAWRQAATLAGRPQLAAWVRDVVAAHLAGRRLPDPGEVERLDLIAAELSKQGANLNQAVKALNELVAAGVVDEAHADAAVEEALYAFRAETTTLREVWRVIAKVDQ